MFQCKACAAKDRHIFDLNKRLDATSSLLERVVAPSYHPAVLTQANIALDGAGVSQEPDDEKHLSPVEKQALDMLTGNY